MLYIALFIGLIFLSVEITSKVNDPLIPSGVAESIKYQPEWSHIHACGGNCE